MHGVLLRLVAARLRRSSDTARGALVLPSDEALVTIPGPDPVRVLVVGSGPAAGVGVTTHEQALTGALARQIAARSDRGAVVMSLGQAYASLSDVPARITGAPIDQFDAVVVTAGMVEAVAMTSDAVWERWLLAVLEMVESRSGRRTPVVLGGMPAPTGAILAAAGRRGRFVDRRASALNRTSRLVMSRSGHWHFAQLEPADHLGGQPTADSYTAWAGTIAEVLTPAVGEAARSR